MYIITALNEKPNPKLHTHWSFPQAAHRPKMPKEYNNCNYRIRHVERRTFANKG